MTSNNRFDAALRAHAFHRSFGEGDHPGEPLPDPAPAKPPLPDFAAKLEASLTRDLNALTAGLRPPPLPRVAGPRRPSGKEGVSRLAKCLAWPHSRQGVAAIVVHRSDASRGSMPCSSPIDARRGQGAAIPTKRRSGGTRIVWRVTR